MPVDFVEQSAELNPEESETAAQAQEYQPGELAPAIITSAKVWKPDDIKKADATLMGTLTDLVNTCSTTDEAARRFQVLRTWQARHFDNGFQYLEESQGGGWSIAGTNVTKGKNSMSAADDANLYPTNIYSAQGDIAIGALCRGQIKVNFSPIRSKVPANKQASDEANLYKLIWAEANNSIELQKQMFGLGWTDSRALGWTRTMANKSRYGMVDGADEPRRVEVTSFHGVLETKLPMMAQTLEECSYAQIWCERDYAVSRAAYPWMGDKIKPSWGTYGELEFERIARINTYIGIVGKYITGTSGIRETTEGYCWFRPGMYYDDKITATQREWLLTNFPDGVFLIMAGPELVCCWNESMDDHLTLGMFCRGFGQNRRSLGDSDIPLQKRINIWADLWDKFVRGAIAIGLLETKAFNAEAIAQLESSTTRFVEVALDENQTMDQVVGQTPVPAPVQGFMEMFQWYIGPLIQSIDGGTPALFGEGEGEDNTVGATQIRLQQALERYGPVWITGNLMFAKANEQAARCCAENGNTEISDTIPGVGDVTVSPAKLKGNFKCKAETINAIPEAGTQREAKAWKILDAAAQNQQVASLIATPSNAREMVSAIHMEDVITVDEANWEDAALEDIEILIESQPLMNPAYDELQQQFQQLNETHEQAKALAQIAAQTGELSDDDIQQGQQMETQVAQLKQQLDQTPRYLPSVPVAQDDSQDHATMAATAFAYFGEPDGRALRKAGERAQEGSKEWGYWQNLFLYWQNHKQVAAKLAAENQQPIPPKTSINIAVDKLVGAAQSQALSKAGIQVGPQDTGGQTEHEQETIQRTPFAEIKTRTKRRL